MVNTRRGKPPTDGSANRGKFRKAFPALIIALAVAICVNLFIVGMRGRVDSLTKGYIELSVMQDHVTDLAASQNELLNPYAAKDKVYGDIASYETQARTSLSRAEALEARPLPRVRDALDSFTSLLDIEVNSVRNGRLKEAASSDLQLDALEEATDQSLNVEESRLGNESASAGKLANASSFALIIFVALGGALGFLRLESARRVVAQKEAGQQVEARYEAIIRNAPVMIALLDQENRFTYVSEGARQVSGMAPESLIGNSVQTFLIDDGQNILTFLDDLRREPGKLVVSEARVIAPDGTIREVEIVANSLMDQSRVQGVAFACTDITERKKALQDISTARDKALEAIKSKSEFLANMSHEIRTPMNGVIGMVDIMMDTPLTSEQKEFMLIVQSSAESLLSIINSILDLSKAEAGKLALETAPLKLRALVEDVAEQIAIQAHGKDVEVIVRAASQSDFCMLADGLRLRQILTNLAGNALKFTEKGEIVLGLKKLRETDSDLTMRLSVEDTGIGISEANQAKVFEIFTQADGSMTRKYGGTGLGLSISQAMAGLMGGSIQCKSVLGEGSTFWTDITFEKVQEERPLDSTPMARFDGLTALIIDDNAVNRQILTEFMVSWGCTVAVAENGEQACNIVADAADSPFNLILLDYQMPGMDGFETAARIKAMGFNSIILMLSSVDANRMHEELSDVGIRRRLVKPVRKDQLKEAISRAMEEDSAMYLSVGASASEPEFEKPDISLRVLLVEDNSVNQKVGSVMLKRLGCQVEIVNDGQEAVDLTALKDFDLVLMDCGMPVLDGYGATAKIREREKFSKKHVPIIALTAHALSGIKEECLAAGMDGYLSKPVTFSALIEALKPWLTSAAA